MAATPKDTIYIDIDDEITGIIDKLAGSGGKVVALVLPKRASVLQSIVNMKLLKRAADESKKNVVLITTEAGLLPLAGMVGVHVAKSLTSKPEIPSAPTTDDNEETVDEESGDIEEPEITAATAGDKPIGQLAGLGAAATAAAASADYVETVELDNDDIPEAGGADAKAKGPKSKGGKKDKKLHVPNFERFRLLLIGGGLLLILLIVGMVFAASTLTKAVINIKTDASNVNANLNLNLSTTAKDLDANTNTLPAKLVQQPKTYTQQATASGQKNTGTKATGSVSMTACIASFSFADSVPAGTGISVNGLTYITQETTKFSHTGTNNGTCIAYPATAPTSITAQNGGANYNVGSTNFKVAGRDEVTATGSAAGGTDNIVQVVSQADIDNAKSKISTSDATVKQALQNQLTQDNYFAIPATFNSGTPAVTTSANVGDAASSVTVTEVVTYSMFGVHADDLKTLVDTSVKGQIDTGKQSILSEGLSSATFSVTTSTATGAQLTMQTVAVAGPQLDEDTIKQEAAGKKSADVRRTLQANPDVTDVDIKLSPFWVNAVPKKTSKITVNIAKPTTTASNANANNP